MLTGWRYRIASVLGAVAITASAVLIANHPFSQWLFTTYVPLFNRLEPTVLSGSALWWALATSIVAIAGCLLPLYKPRPRRALDAIFLTHKRVVTGGLALSAFGFFKWSHRLPRATLVMIVGLVFVAMPIWFVWMRRRPMGTPGRTLVVGDDPEQIKRIAPTLSATVLGYLCPTTVLSSHLSTDRARQETSTAIADGGMLEFAELDGLERLGGLSRLEDVLVAYDVDTVVLAFQQPDRAEFFGALDACHEHGVSAKVHREYADSVLVSDGGVGELVDVDLEPWDPLDHMLKRGFDVAFAVAGLLAFAPLMIVIAATIKLDSRGPVLYGQDRTAGLGETFPIYKFRTMIPEGESATPVDDDANNRITRIGHILRQTHLDELPQLLSILTGEMSVVGPRAVWTDEEQLLEREAVSWRKRWFVKPGLTGLAQVNNAKSTDPNAKLRYDLEYIRRQSFWFDLKIVIRQVWMVLEDVWATLRP